MPLGTHNLLRESFNYASLRMGCRPPNRADQFIFRKRLRQKGSAADLNRFFADCCGVDGCHENDRDRRASCREPTPRLYSRHAAQVNIKNDAGNIA